MSKGRQLQELRRRAYGEEEEMYSAEDTDTFDESTYQAETSRQRDAKSKQAALRWLGRAAGRGAD